MFKKDNSELEIDLVFKCNNSLDHFQNQKDNLIFESSFWERVFLSWITIIINEKDPLFPEFIFEKKIFSLSLQIINDNEISYINQKWMKKAGPTDVLSFPIMSYDDTSKDLIFIELGDLFISLLISLLIISSAFALNIRS